MFSTITRRRILLLSSVLFLLSIASGQTSLKTKFSNSSVYAGIEVGSKGVKMSVVEIGKNAKSSGSFNILKDTSVNTDFISFSPQTSEATLNALAGFYDLALRQYRIPYKRIYTVISSGVKIQSEKEKKTDQVSELINAFKTKVKEPDRLVEVVDVMQEARLSHLGIVPDSRRYTTFLIDIGSGNTKGGYFPHGNTRDFYLFQLSWGTKSTANATEKLAGQEKSIPAYSRNLTRVLSDAENSEIIYAINVSGAYPLSDYIAFSGGIAWSVATLMYPELLDNSVVPVTYEDVVKFSEKLYRNFPALSDSALVQKIAADGPDKAAVIKEVKRVHGVFDQKSLMAGTGLLLKIMRQFKSVYETKDFYLVKNGQVGWVSAYVDEDVKK